MPARKVFAESLLYFHTHVMAELADIKTGIGEDEVRWVLSVPAIWSATAKKFMRFAAYDAEIGSPSRPEQFVIRSSPKRPPSTCSTCMTLFAVHLIMSYLVFIISIQDSV